MKPRNKKEQAIVGMAGKLPPLTEAAKRWSRSIFTKNGYYLRREKSVWCQCCGHIEKTSETILYLEAIGYTCPSCGEKLSVSPYTDPTKYRIIGYSGVSRWCAVVQTYQGHQVFRTFEVTRTNTKGEPTNFTYPEIFQVWIDQSGRETITCRPYTRSVFSLVWDTHSPFWIGRHNSRCAGYYAFDDLFDLSGVYFYPRMSFTPEIARTGISSRMVLYSGREHLSPVELIRKINTDPYNETLLKTGQVALFVHMVKHPHANLVRHAVNICNRNGYKINDPGLWLDYIQDLELLGLDTHNAHYVCPADLKEAHRLTGRRVAKLSTTEKEKRKAAVWETRYKEMRKPYLDIKWQGNGVRVYTAPSVEEIRKEANRMGHCVFRGGYYKNRESLIMLAVDSKTGKHLETVEVNLERFEINQSRGYANNPTDRHNDIINLVNKNMPQIRRIALA